MINAHSTTQQLYIDMSISNSPSEIIAQLVVKGLHGTDATAGNSWPVYISNEPENPDSLIVVTDAVGVKQGRFQIGGQFQEHYGVQVLVRSIEHQIGWQKAEDIAVSFDEDTLNTSVSLEAITGTETITYTIASISRSPILSLGMDRDSNRHFFSLNIRVALRQLA